MKNFMFSFLLLSSFSVIAADSTLYMIYNPGVRGPNVLDQHEEGIKPVDGSKHFKVELPKLDKYDSFSCLFYGYAKVDGVRIGESEESEDEYYDTVSMELEFDDNMLDYDGELSSTYSNLTVLSGFEVPAIFDRVQIEPLYTQTVIANNNVVNLFLQSGIFSIDQERRSGSASMLTLGTKETLFMQNFYSFRDAGIKSPEDVKYIDLKHTSDEDESLSYNYEFNDAFDKKIVYGVDVKCSFQDDTYSK